MAATVEADVVTTEEVTVEIAPAELREPAVKPAKEKKPKVPKEKKPKTAKVSPHPPYFQMIKEALLALNEKSGSSPYAIAKYMEEKHKSVLPANFRKILALQLKNSAAKGKLSKIKASYKLSEAGKKEKGIVKIVKTEAVKKPNKQAKSTAAAPKTRSMKKKEATKKAVKPTKKVGTKRTRKSTAAKPKQPKSIKSPAAKKAKKATP